VASQLQLRIIKSQSHKKSKSFPDNNATALLRLEKEGNALALKGENREQSLKMVGPERVEKGLEKCLFESEDVGFGLLWGRRGKRGFGLRLGTWREMRVLY
jgi:hypothetical protein